MPFKEWGGGYEDDPAADVFFGEYANGDVPNEAITDPAGTTTNPVAMVPQMMPDGSTRMVNAYANPRTAAPAITRFALEPEPPSLFPSKPFSIPEPPSTLKTIALWAGIGLTLWTVIRLFRGKR